jgi:signal transduction histidine kinase
VVIAVALAAAAVSTIIALKLSLLSSIDAAARDDAHEVAAQLAHELPDGQITPPAPDAAVQVIDAQRNVVAASPHAPRHPLLAAGGAAQPTITATGRLPLPSSADAYHIAALRTHDGTYTIYVALPSDDVTDTVGRLMSVLMIGTPILALLLAAVAWIVVGRALAPVHALHQRQQEFVSDAAHELRNPLSGLLARLELAASGGDAGSRREFQLLRTEVARIASVVDGLLALVRASNHRPPSADVDLDDVILQSVQRIRARTTLTVDTTCVKAVRIRGDQAGLLRLIDNLLDNAARYANSTISISLTTHRQICVLTVADDGPGIPPADRERVFNRFTRLDNSRPRSDGGVGLGLAIVRAVADAHRGRVTIYDNQPGARFVIRIPGNIPHQR